MAINSSINPSAGAENFPGDLNKAASGGLRTSTTRYLERHVKAGRLKAFNQLASCGGFASATWKRSSKAAQRVEVTYERSVQDVRTARALHLALCTWGLSIPNDLTSVCPKALPAQPRKIGDVVGQQGILAHF